MKLGKTLRAKLAKIKCLATDIDGVMTDGHIYHVGDNNWSRSFYIRDGMGLMLLREAGFKTAFITNSQSEDIRLRAERLKIDYVYEGAGQKGDVFRELCKKSHLKPDEILFIGDDIIDLPVFKLCGISVAPADAHPEVLKQAKIVTKANGGRGSVREICDILLHLKLSV